MFQLQEKRSSQFGFDWGGRGEGGRISCEKLHTTSPLPRQIFQEVGAGGRQEEKRKVALLFPCFFVFFVFLFFNSDLGRVTS